MTGNSFYYSKVLGWHYWKYLVYSLWFHVVNSSKCHLCKKKNRNKHWVTSNIQLWAEQGPAAGWVLSSGGAGRVRAHDLQLRAGGGWQCTDLNEWLVGHEANIADKVSDKHVLSKSKVSYFGFCVILMRLLPLLFHSSF